MLRFSGDRSLPPRCLNRPPQGACYGAGLCFANFSADSSRIVPKIKYNRELDTNLKRLLPTKAPRIEPDAIELINPCSDLTSLSLLGLLYLNKPIKIVGMLIVRLKLPASLISTEKSKIIVGIINSPPATPNILLNIPMIVPAKNPKLTLKRFGNCKLSRLKMRLCPISTTLRKTRKTTTTRFNTHSLIRVA